MLIVLRRDDLGGDWRAGGGEGILFLSLWPGGLVPILNHPCLSNIYIIKLYNVLCVHLFYLVKQLYA